MYFEKIPQNVIPRTDVYNFINTLSSILAVLAPKVKQNKLIAKAFELQLKFLPKFLQFFQIIISF